MNITVSAFAKLNLYLDITGRRDDGYHTLKTVMHTVDLRDSVTLSLRQSGISLNTDKPFIPNDERNIAHKAAKLFLSHIGEKKGVDISIVKRIPVGGGLGGSSTDGAAVLSGLNYLFGRPLSEDELITLGARLGADVPFCMKKGAALCEGIGDILTPLSPFKSAFAVIVKPQFSLNTAEMYSLFDKAKASAAPKAAALIGAVKANDISAASENLFNSFYAVARTLRPEIERIRMKFFDFGAQNVCMSGSGSCLFALFDSSKKCNDVCSSLLFNGFEAYSVRLI